jgi:threonylcarbamoyladenosine tRNA methylthiotransferase MtaB
VEVKSPQSFEPLSAVKDGRTRATLKIQDGCTNFCSYCIIPYVRGPLRSRPLADVETELRALADEGYREVVLSGIHLCSYGRDLGGVDLLDVLSLTRRIAGIERVRLGSLEPGFVDERFAAAVAENGKVCDQFHLSLQSGSPTVLARMKRRYTPEAFAHSVSLLRKALPNCALTTDVIAGFPGETDVEHQESLAFCEEIRFSRMHVFPYSARPGTAAAAMPDPVPKAAAAARARALIACGEGLRRQYLQKQLGKSLSVLVEKDGIGFATNYVQVRAGGRAGEIRLVNITGMDKELLIGEEA